jgi:hypothetical protein
MKKILILASIMLFAGFIKPCVASTFSDDFNDGNLDGWISLSGFPVPCYGNWQISNGVLIATPQCDYPVLAVKDNVFSDQAIESKFMWYQDSPIGITLWWQDTANYVKIFQRYQGGAVVLERVGNYDKYTFYPNDIWELKWHTIKVIAKSSTGEIEVYIDGNYLFTHTVQADAVKSGLSGFNANGAGGEFDDFRVTSNEIPVAIDVRPWVKSNTINIKGMRMINVALLATNDFSPFKQIDTKTLTFGATGNEGSLLGCLRKARDINRDSFADLICSFSTKSTGLQCGDKEVILKGKMKTTGIPFEAKQDVSITPCKNKLK